MNNLVELRTQARKGKQCEIKLEEKLALLGRLIKTVPKITTPFSLSFLLHNLMWIYAKSFDILVGFFRHLV